MQKLSFVIPCYRSMETIGAVVDEIERTMAGAEGYTYEIVLVDDCSPGGLWPVLEGLARERPHVIAIALARNFGQHAALMAGYHYVTGDVVISLDDDGQTPADQALELVRKLDEGYDVVFARYRQNMESAFRRFGSWVNAKMAEHMLGKPRDIAVQSYFAARRFIIDEILKYEHAYPYISGLVFRTTQNVANVEVTHRSRTTGKSNYTFAKLLGLWMNGFTAFSIKPLRIATLLGVVCALLGFAMGAWFVVQKFIDPTVPMGYSSIISAIVFFGGLNMLMLGLIGEYIGRIYICLNRSPQYVVRTTTLDGGEGTAPAAGGPRT